MKKIGLYICMCLMLSCIVGCSKVEKDKITDKKENKITEERKNSKIKFDKDILVITDNCELVYSNSGGINTFLFYIITKERVTEQDIKVDIDCDVEYNTFLKPFGLMGEVSEEDIEELDVSPTIRTTMAYNGIDWKEYLKVYQEGTEEDLKQLENKYNKDYTGVIDCYFYEVKIQFQKETVKKDENVTKMNVEYNGNKIEKDVDIRFIYNIRDLSREYRGAFSSISESTTVHEWINPNRTGKVASYNISYKAEKDVVIKGVKCIGDNGTYIESVDVSGTVVNNIQQKLQGDIHLKKGDTINLRINLKDKDFVNQLVYNKDVIMRVDYEVDGHDDYEVYEIMYSSTVRMDELYAQYVDGVDMMAYYTDFYNVIHGYI